MKFKCTKGIVSILLSLMLIMSMLPMGTIQAMAEEIHECTYENGFCTECDGYEKPEILQLSTYKYFGFRSPDVALIRNAGNLYYFSTKLTTGYYPNALLMNDIIVNEDLHNNGGIPTNKTPREWIPFSLPYSVFNGNGYEISGLYLYEEDRIASAFILTNNTTICNLGITNSYFQNQVGGFTYTGGICATNYGTIDRCYFNGTILSNGYYVGGITGNSSGIITDCYNLGTVTGNCESAGIDSKMGYLLSNNVPLPATLQYSFNMGSINGNIIEKPIYSKHAVTTANLENENLFFKNIYYLNTCGADDDYAEAKTKEQFASGELTELLNDGRTENNAVWYQDKVKGRPELIKKHLTYENLINGIPLNPTEYCDKNGHSYKNGFCTNPRFDNSPCNAFEPANDSDGNGYYEIKNGGQLCWFSEQVNKGRYSIKGELMDNVYVNTNVVNTDGTLNTEDQLINWTPIGNTESNAFEGDFNGNNYKIHGLYVPKTTKDTSIGLFGISYGSIKNVTLVNSYFGASPEVIEIGTICGALANSSITNCTNENTIIDATDCEFASIGGICGFATGATITSAQNNCNITTNASNSNIGGVLGNIEYCTLDKCINNNTIAITGTDNNVGGISGYTKNTSSVNCSNKGNISCDGNSIVGGIFGSHRTERSRFETKLCFNEGEIIAGDNSTIGGIIGDNYVYGTHTITECYNTGKISGANDTQLGGICGTTNTTSNTKNKLTITKCYNTADITAQENSYAGGISAQTDKNCEITNCYNNGNISSTYGGGISGKNSSAISLCNNTGNITATYGGGITGENSNTISNSYNTGNITANYGGGITSENSSEISECYNTGNVSASIYGGGISSENDGTFSKCYNEGEISATSINAYLGGLSGSNKANGAIENSYNAGKLSANDSVVGGISGYNEGTIKNSFNHFEISANNPKAFPICNETSNDKVENCYYASEDTSENEIDTCEGTTKKTADQFASGEVTYLLNGQTYEGDLIWYQTIGEQAYPTFEGELVYSDDEDYSNYPIISIFGDINLKFKQSSENTNMYVAYVDLEEGVYNFKVRKNKEEFAGRNFCFDTTYSVEKKQHLSMRYYSHYTSSSELKATGGRYTFVYRTDGDYMFINYISSGDVVELLDSVTNDQLISLQKTSGTIYTGLIRIDKPTTYKFIINDSGTFKGGTYHFVDTKYKDGVINNIMYTEEWSGATTLEMSGGVYALSYDQSKSFLSIQYRVPESKTITVFGDITLNLNQVKGSDHMYSSTIALNAGEYCFRIDKFGDVMCNGDIIENSTTYTPFSITWDRPSILRTQGGKYTFTYDSNINYLKIIYTPIESEQVSVEFDYQRVVLEQDGNSTVYTGIATLKEGKHKFFVNDFGSIYRNGWTYTNIIQNCYLSNTLYNNSGIYIDPKHVGQYVVTYDTATKKLNIYPYTEEDVEEAPNETIGE